MAIFGAPRLLVVAFGIRSNIPREVCAGQGYGGYWRDREAGALAPLLLRLIRRNTKSQSQRRRARVRPISPYGVAARVPPGAWATSSIKSVAILSVRWRATMSFSSR